MDLTRGLFVQVSGNPESEAVAALAAGVTPGLLEMSLTQAETGDLIVGGVFYKLDQSSLGIDHRNLGDHPVITITLAEPLSGEVQGDVFIQDGQGGFGSALLQEVASSGGLRWEATINGNNGGTVDASQAIGVGITFLGFAQSDVSIVIDSIAVVPEPTAVLLLVASVLLQRCRRGITHATL